jgi:ankyrin repeat protein
MIESDSSIRGSRLCLCSFAPIRLCNGAAIRLSVHLDLEDKGGRTPLSWAAEKGWQDIVQFLYDKGARLDQKDNMAEKSHRGIMFLCDKSAHVNQPDRMDWTLLSVLYT